MRRNRARRSVDDDSEEEKGSILDTGSRSFSGKSISASVQKSTRDSDSIKNAIQELFSDDTVDSSSSISSPTESETIFPDQEIYYYESSSKPSIHETNIPHKMDMDMDLEFLSQWADETPPNQKKNDLYSGRLVREEDEYLEAEDIHETQPVYSKLSYESDDDALESWEASRVSHGHIHGSIPSLYSSKPKVSIPVLSIDEAFDSFSRLMSDISEMKNNLKTQFAKFETKIGISNKNMSSSSEKSGFYRHLLVLVDSEGFSNDVESFGPLVSVFLKWKSLYATDFETAFGLDSLCEILATIVPPLSTETIFQIVEPFKEDAETFTATVTNSIKRTRKQNKA